MSSVSSRVREALEGYVAGRLRAEAVVAAVADAYYREGGSGMRDALAPVVAVIERAAPGVAALGASERGPGFEIRLAARGFPAEYEAELRRAAVAVLGAGREPSAGLLRRVVAAVRRLFTASA